MSPFLIGEKNEKEAFVSSKWVFKCSIFNRKW